MPINRSMMMKLRILAIGDSKKNDLRHLLSLKEQHNITYIDSRVSKETRFDWKRILEVRELLKYMQFDIVAIGRCPRERTRNGVNRYARKMFRVIKDPIRLMHMLVLREARTKIKLAIDLGDSPLIDPVDRPLFDACDLYFKRELQPNRLNCFLFTHSMFNKRSAIQAVYSSSQLEKLRSISLGIDSKLPFLISNLSSQEKKYDIFFLGKTEHSFVRMRGMQQIHDLEGRGIRVFIPRERMSPQDFYDTCIQSLIVWSPEGTGWDCIRHYEAAIAGAVPLMNFPTIERFRPFRSGVHALYYGIEDDGLSEVVLKSMREPSNLIKMGESARAHAMEFHTYEKIGGYIIEEAISLMS